MKQGLRLTIYTSFEKTFQMVTNYNVKAEGWDDLTERPFFLVGMTTRQTELKHEWMRMGLIKKVQTESNLRYYELTDLGKARLDMVCL